MAKSSTAYVCQNCEQSHSRWQGQCAGCGAWNTLVEQIIENKKSQQLNTKNHKVGDFLIKLPDVDALEGSKNRLSTGIGEFDRVLGGQFGDEKAPSGIVPGSVMLVGGEPGIGKSTLLTQLVINLLASPIVQKIMYVCGEESPSQISLRINRIVNNEHKKIKKYQDKLLFVTTTSVESIGELIQKNTPSLVIVDSIQTLTSDDLAGAAGSPGQIRQAADYLTDIVKPLHIPTFLVGHVTKDGVIAGPKILEHIVDGVLELSGDRTGDLRILRAIKNRFGATDEVGVFRINEVGLQEVSNPSQVFLEYAEQSVPGSSTTCIMEGTRPLLIEVQALVLSSQLAMPRRVGRGIDISRIQVLSAILEKHAKIPLGFCDIFLSVAGGIVVKEPAIDLGLAVAIASSHKNKILPKKTIFIGEVGLLGEIRNVPYLDRRIKEAKRLGYERVICRNTHTRVKDVLKELELL